ncbi:MAG: tetratricopeptide repeat protein [Undibacterium sp.]|nr:tetratricopeptide repeat protein [Undibacterium sp.]
MSLINQMLQDLEQRNDAIPESGANKQYAQFGTPAPAARSVSMVWLGLGFLALLSIMVVSIFVWTRPNAVTAPVAHDVQVVGELPASLQLKLATNFDHPSLSQKTQKAEPLPATSNDKIIVPPKLIAPENSNAAPKPAADETKTQPKPEKPVAAANLAMVKEMSSQQRAEGEYRQASVFQQQGRVSEAIIALQQALKLDARHTPARQSLVTLLLEQSRQDEAMRELKAGLAIDPTQVNFAMMLARLQLERAKLNDAIETLQLSLPQAQDRPDYLAFLAALHQKLGQHKEAVQWYRAALKRHPQNGVWWMGLGISHQADGANQEAIDAFKQAKAQTGLSAELQAFVDQKIAQLQK